jgi:hypothetical protein
MDFLSFHVGMPNGMSCVKDKFSGVVAGVLFQFVIFSVEDELGHRPK